MYDGFPPPDTSACEPVRRRKFFGLPEPPDRRGGERRQFTDLSECIVALQLEHWPKLPTCIFLGTDERQLLPSSRQRAPQHSGSTPSGSTHICGPETNCTVDVRRHVRCRNTTPWMGGGSTQTPSQKNLSISYKLRQLLRYLKSCISRKCGMETLDPINGNCK